MDEVHITNENAHFELFRVGKSSNCKGIWIFFSANKCWQMSYINKYFLFSTCTIQSSTLFSINHSTKPQLCVSYCNFQKFNYFSIERQRNFTGFPFIIFNQMAGFCMRLCLVNVLFVLLKLFAWGINSFVMNVAKCALLCLSEILFANSLRLSFVY